MKKLNEITSTRAVTQFTYEGKLIAKYRSANDAYEITGIDSKRITECCRGTKISVAGYTFRFTNWRYPLEKKASNPIIQMKDGKVVQTFDSIYEASTALGCHSNVIYDNVTGFTESAMGYQFKYV